MSHRRTFENDRRRGTKWRRSFGLRLVQAALLLGCCAPSGAWAAGADRADRPLVIIRGNLLFDELVYRSVLQLPPSTKATPASAAMVATKLRSFLFRAGYELATVSAAVEDGQIAVDVDEGRLDKIIISGEGILETIRFKMELALPASVYNRPSLERQLKVLGQRYHFINTSYALVAAEVREEFGPRPELEDYEGLFGLGVLPGVRYQLHIKLSSKPWGRGFSPDLSIDSPEGLGGGGHYQGMDSLANDDRWLARVRIAGGARDHLGGGGRPVLTRALGEVRWISPALTESLRPSVHLSADWLSLQRGDLGLDQFEQATFTAGLDAGLFDPRWTATLGLGLERRFLFHIDRLAGFVPPLAPVPEAQTRPYAEAVGQLVFDPEDARTDRHHKFRVEARLYLGSPSSGETLQLRASWQRRFPFGWHEVWCEARATWLQGEVLFADEESVGSHLRGVFGGEFIRRVASANCELRYSFLRDVFRVGLFYGQAVYQSAIDRTTNDFNATTAGSAGPAMHFLISDEFQLDLYAAIGWRLDGSTGFSPSLSLRQVF